MTDEQLLTMFRKYKKKEKYNNSNYCFTTFNIGGLVFSY